MTPLVPAPDYLDIAAVRPPKNASSWQCPGCLTWYAYWVSKCECQKRAIEQVITTTGIGVTPTQWGTFTSELG